MSTLLQVNKYICENNLDLALEAIETLNQEESNIGQIVKSRILVDKGDIDESSSIVNEILNHEIQDSVVTFGAIMAKIHIFWKTGRYNEISELVEEGNKILETIQTNKSDIMLWFMGNYFNGIGNYYWDMGNLSEALDSYIKGYQIRKDLGNKIEIAKSLTNLGNIHYIRGEYDLALEKYQETILLKQSVQNDVDFSAVLSNIGAVYLDKGELNKALINFTQSLRYLAGSNDEPAKAFRYVNIGQIFIIKGDLDRALNYLEKSIRIYELIGNKFLLARSLSFIGKIYMSKNKLSLANEFLTQSLEFHYSFENGFEISKTLYIMILLKIEQGLREEALYFLRKLEEIKKQKSNEIITLRYLLSKALVHNTATRLIEKSNAQEIFHGITKNSLLNEIIKMEARLGYCELLITEYEVLQNPTLLNEIVSLINQIYKYGQREQAYLFIIKSLILKSRLNYSLDNVSRAYKLLEIADFYCDERDLNLCKSKITKIRKTFNLNTSKQQEFISKKQMETSNNYDIIEYLEDLKQFKLNIGEDV
ncbi:MAG: tetratricopeptide repeat protein [Candidatus Heimdallarchaeota archaeon]|nr:tetratricopeptide repeat protein [Candidatus Heimdallarchaeota archaeon]